MNRCLRVEAKCDIVQDAGIIVGRDNNLIAAWPAWVSAPKQLHGAFRSFNQRETCKGEDDGSKYAHTSVQAGQACKEYEIIT